MGSPRTLKRRRQRQARKLHMAWRTRDTLDAVERLMRRQYEGVLDAMVNVPNPLARLTRR